MFGVFLVKIRGQFYEQMDVYKPFKFFLILEMKAEKKKTEKELETCY